MKPSARSGSLVLAAVAISIVSIACKDRRTGEVPPADAGPGAQYVGSSACRSCHAETWSTFSHTGMGHSWYALTPAVAIEDWDHKNGFANAGTGLHYRMTRRGERFFMRQFLLDARGSEVAVDERELIWVVGSAHHSRTYLVVSNGRLYQAPVCWYPKDAVWDLCPGYEHDNDYFSREIGRTCVFCHNGRMELRKGMRNAYLEPFPQGVDCERCHGPGALHVDKWARGETPSGKGDPSIVNPRRLTPELRMQICFQCHLGDSQSTERVARTDRRLEDFRPGQPIGSAMVPFRYADALPHEFGLSAQADRLLLSKCFAGARGTLECVTCHDPHVTVYRKDRPTDFFDAKCLGCHARDACRAPQSERGRTNPPDDCVACHMRKAEPSDHRHAVFTDHWIRRRIDEAPRPRASSTLVPYLAGDFDALPAADKAFYTGRAYSLRALALPPAVRLPLWGAAEAAFGEAIGLGLDRSDAWFFRGKALGALGKRDLAAVAQAKAYEKAPHDHDVAFAHAQGLLSRRRYDEADRILEATAREHPESAAPLAELGRSLALRGRIGEALERFRQAVTLEPSNPQLHESTAMMLSATGRHDEAVAEMEAAVRFAPEKPGIWDSYATILSRAGRRDEAKAASERVAVLRAGR